MSEQVPQERRVVTAVPDVADAFGYDIEAALEDPDDH